MVSCYRTILWLIRIFYLLLYYYILIKKNTTAGSKYKRQLGQQKLMNFYRPNGLINLGPEGSIIILSLASVLEF